MMTDINLHIIGLGNLGQSFLNGFNNIDHGFNIYLYEENSEVVNNLNTTYEIQESINEIDDGVVLLCIKPNDLNSFINLTKSKISSGVLIASPIAGTTISHYENNFENKIIRLMPNLSISNNSGFIPFTKNYEEDYLGFISKLNLLGETHEYSEDLFDIITAIFGSGPAWYFELSSKITDSAVNLGMKKEDAKLIVQKLMLSLPSLVGNNDFDQVVNNIKSPNGTTEAGLNSLANDSFDKVIFNAIESAVNRSIEISKDTDDE